MAILSHVDATDEHVHLCEIPLTSAEHLRDKLDLICS